MEGSGFEVTPENKEKVVVPSLAPQVVDQDFLDAMNPAAGQFSSLEDMIKFAQNVLSPSSDSLLHEYQKDKWFKPVHAFDEDDWTEMGLMWEIVKTRDSNGRVRRVYWKLGAMAGHHAALAFHPGSGYAVIVLLAGHYPDAAKVAYEIIRVFQPSIDIVAAETASELYAGTYTSTHNSQADATGENQVQVEQATKAVVSVRKGTLYLDTYLLAGIDVLQLFGAPPHKPLPLRPSGRAGEFRVDTGFPVFSHGDENGDGKSRFEGYNGEVHMGCYPYWNGQDLWGVGPEGASVNVVVLDGEGAMRVPGVGVVLERV
ncbi:hypothetical protein EIP91_006729 [Steccherinum ochraceum]|uniref:Beta-lactamase-related domain-containing protein n=1 Tax=Steccherinum ochraceum TaxID=92696 RepID=A0A4R0RDN9_9APHY|nr:hypothetical protein EIP91_006729 [Steccherinum ochraceum]